MLQIEETIRSLILSADPRVYIGEASIDVDDCSWIVSVSGRSNVHFNKETYDYPSYIVYVRGVDNKEAKARVDKVYHKLNNYTGSSFVILTKQLPRYVGRDQKHRAIYSFRIEYQLGGY